MNIKKRLELVKLVEECVRAYNSSTEKHDQSIGAPRQVRKPLPEAYPSQVPYLLPAESPSSLSATVMEPRTPEMTRPKRASVDSDDSHRDAVGFSLSQFNALYRNRGYSTESGLGMSRRLQQVNGLFVSENPEGAVRKAEESARASTESSVQAQKETEYTRIPNERADKAESDVHSLKAAIVSLKKDKEAADARCQDCLATICTLESAITSAQEETKRLNEELAEGVAKLLNAEKHYQLLEKENHSLEKVLEGMVQRAEMQRRELLENQEELRKLQNHLKEESKRVIQAETALQDLHNLHFQCEEEEHERTIKSQIEIFILQKCIRDMEEKNVVLLMECEKYFQEYKLSEKLISDLEQEYHAQQLEVKWLSDQLQSLRFGIREMLESVNGHPAYESEGKMKEDQVLLQCILKKIEDTENTLSQERNEKHQVLFENEVLVTHINQMKQEMSNHASERFAHDQQLKTRMQELLVIQTEKQDLLNMNEQLRSEAGAAEKQEAFLKYELETLHEKFSNLQEAYTITRNQNSKLRERNGLLMKKLLALDKVKRILEEENNLVLGEAISLANLSLITIEDHVLLQKKLRAADNQDAASSTGLPKKTSRESREATQALASPNDVFYLQGLQTKIKAVGEAVIEIEKLAIQESFLANVKSENSMEEEIDKDLFIDKQEIPTLPQYNEKNILERLSSDAHKISNLQISIEDLRKKMEMNTKKGKKIKGIGYKSLKVQLQAVEDALVELIDTTIILATKVEGSPSLDEAEESREARKRRVVEQAQRGSESIGRLELEVERIEFAVVKLEEEKSGTRLHNSRKIDRGIMHPSCFSCIRLL